MPRGRKPGFVMSGVNFYVYKIIAVDGSIAYIGKGSGRRLSTQQRRFGMPGEIMRTFVSERAAYNFEARAIRDHKPPLNKAAGGGGAIARRKPKLHKWFKEIARLGTRVWIARQLLKLDLRGHVDEGKMSMLRSVAASSPLI